MDNRNSDLQNHFGMNNKNNVPKKTQNEKISLNHEKMSEEEYLELVHKKMKERRRIAEKRRVRRNRIVAVLLLLVIIVVAVRFCSSHKADKDTSLSQNSSSQVQKVSAVDKGKTSEKKSTEQKKKEPKIEEKNGMTFVDGILIVNKTYSLPSNYNPGTIAKAQNAFDEMAQAAAADGITLFVNSGFRTYQEQEELYNGYAQERGTGEADKVSSRPGHSEHQTGLTFDVNTTELSFEGTPEAVWLAKHCAEYGFIIRYPKGKEDETGYIYEPWHIRYLGRETAEKVTKSGLSLEKYLGITSDYKYAKDQNCTSR